MPRPRKFWCNGKLQDAGKVVVLHRKRHRGRAEIRLLEDEQPRLRLDRTDDLGQAGLERRIVAGDADAGIDEATDVAARQVFERRRHFPPLRSR